MLTLIAVLRQEGMSIFMYVLKLLLPTWAHDLL